LGPSEGSGSSARETVVSEALLSPLEEAQATCGFSQHDTDKGMDMQKQELFQLNLNSIITTKVCLERHEKNGGIYIYIYRYRFIATQ
jgi:hypothetical protein